MNKFAFIYDQKYIAKEPCDLKYISFFKKDAIKKGTKHLESAIKTFWYLLNNLKEINGLLPKIGINLLNFLTCKKLLPFSIG